MPIINNTKLSDGHPFKTGAIVFGMKRPEPRKITPLQEAETTASINPLDPTDVQPVDNDVIKSER